MINHDGGRRVRVTLRARVSHASVAVIAAGLLAATAGVGRSAIHDRTPSAALTTAAMSTEVVGTRAAARTTTANRQAAIRDSARLLAGVIPPPGAVVVSKRSAIGVQRKVPLLTTAFASALASERWSVPGHPGTVLPYVESHLPPGSKLFSTGFGGPAPSSQSVIRSWAPVSDILDTRWLEIEVAGGSDGGTDLFAESQSQWVVARPARERIPAGVTQVDVTEGLPGQSPTFSRAVIGPGTVRRLVALFNSLGIVQPGAINCPSETVEPIITVAFRGAANGPALAVATVDSLADFSWPDSLPGWACFSIGFVAGGHTFDSLIGNVISPIDHLLHVHLQRQGRARTGSSLRPLTATATRAKLSTGSILPESWRSCRKTVPARSSASRPTRRHAIDQSLPSVWPPHVRLPAGCFPTASAPASNAGTSMPPQICSARRRRSAAQSCSSLIRVAIRS